MPKQSKYFLPDCCLFCADPKTPDIQPVDSNPQLTLYVVLLKTCKQVNKKYKNIDKRLKTLDVFRSVKSLEIGRSWVKRWVLTMADLCSCVGLRGAHDEGSLAERGSPVGLS